MKILCETHLVIYFSHLHSNPFFFITAFGNSQSAECMLVQSQFLKIHKLFFDLLLSSTISFGIGIESMIPKKIYHCLMLYFKLRCNVFYILFIYNHASPSSPPSLTDKCILFRRYLLCLSSYASRSCCLRMCLMLQIYYLPLVAYLFIYVYVDLSRNLKSVLMKYTVPEKEVGQPGILLRRYRLNFIYYLKLMDSTI